jgi:hypothetical protein
MWFRAVAVTVCLLAGVGAHVPVAWADERAFTLSDYETYFAPGRFATHSTYYASDGLLEILSRRAIDIAGQHMLEQTVRSLDISSNYDEGSEYPFYKIEGRSIDHMLWNDRRRAYLYEYTDADFDANDSTVWESHDTEIGISPGDLLRGAMHVFYREADQRLGRDVKALDDNYRRDVVGMWSWSCAYLSNSEFEVACRAVHQPTHREEVFYYRRLDLVG